MSVRFCKIALSLAVVLATAAGANASLTGNSAYVIGGGSDNVGEPNYSLGFAFSPTENIDVTALGYYNGVGTSGVLADSHEVAIWAETDTATPVAFAAVQTSDANQASYTYAVLASPVRLFAGTNYRIAGKATLADGWHYSDTPADFPFDSKIQFLPAGSFGGYYVDAFGSSVLYPSTAGGHFYAPANFLFVEAPEPASMSLLGLAGVVLVARRKKTRG